MAKLPALWTSRDGSSTVTQNSGHLLLESSGGLLLESSGSYLLLEDISVAPKEATIWDAPSAKNPAQYTSQDGYSSVTNANAGVQRTQQDGTIRTLQDGTVRVLEDITVTPKAPAVWDSL